MKGIVFSLYERDSYHIPLITVFLYACSCSYEMGVANYNHIPISLISMGMTNIIWNVTTSVVFLFPILLIEIILSRLNFSSALKFVVSNVLFISYLVYSSSANISFVPLLGLSSAFILSLQYIFFSFSYEGDVNKRNELIMIFIFVITTISICYFIGSYPKTESRMDVVSIKNKQYKLITTYGDNIFVKDENNKTIWLRADADNEIKIN
ncbi:hypothetical protein HGT73_05380 [Rosenbergiella australiborealis]|uniref:Uncharacterized protein n=1 Tax=Rosenbergiella australiborealis TaxID=1544696 RepID=A0ABS5T392_9GAMM|nr:hypothetical protein [Rosenbergiella australiborealis]MBT0726819.1 hypothetical protein [Rosenbergiella australiborealis]